MLIISRNGTMDESQYLRHAMAAAQRPKEFAHSFDNVKEIMEHPICNKCEKVALRTHGWRIDRSYVCPNCGDTGKATAFLRGYLKEKGYK